MALSITQPGVILTGPERLRQSLDLFFRTAKYSICLHNELGCDLYKNVDRNYTTVLGIIRDVNNGVKLWDPEILLIKVLPIFEVRKLTMEVTYAPADGSSGIVTQIFNVE